MTSERPNNPNYDAFMDSQSENLNVLAQNPQFLEALQHEANIITTTIGTNKQFEVKTRDMPMDLDHLVYLPDTMIVERVAVEMIEHPATNVWSLSGMFTGNRLNYGFAMTESQTTIEVNSSDGGTLSFTFPVSLGFEILACFARTTGYSDTAEIISTTPLREEMNPGTVKEFLRQIGEKYGSVHTRTEAKLEALSEFSRVLSIDLAQLESLNRSSHKLVIDGAVDFGAKVDAEGTTAMSYSQLLTCNNIDGTVEEDSWVSREAASFPIESYLQEKYIFGSMIDPEQKRLSQDPRTFGQVATFIAVSFEELLYQNSFDTPDTGRA